MLPNPRLNPPLSGVTALAQSRKRRATGRARQARRYTDMSRKGGTSTHRLLCSCVLVVLASTVFAATEGPNTVTSPGRRRGQ